MRRRAGRWLFNRGREIGPDDWRELEYLLPEQKLPARGEIARPVQSADGRLEWDFVLGQWQPRNSNKGTKEDWMQFIYAGLAAGGVAFLFAIWLLLLARQRRNRGRRGAGADPAFRLQFTRSPRPFGEGDDTEEF